MTQSREQFEARYLIPEGVTWDDREQRYKLNPLQGSERKWDTYVSFWIVWRSSREDVVVKLPEGGYWAGYDNEHMMESRDVRDAIESAGLRVSP